MQFLDFKFLDINASELKSAFSNVLFWRRYFHRDEIQRNEITAISEEVELSLNGKEYYSLEEQKEYEYEVKSDYILFKKVLVRFELSSEYSFLLDINFPALYFYNNGEIELIATNDEAHFAPDLLRRDELENICKLLAQKYDSLVHPGIPFLLFWYYCPITKDINPNEFIQLLNEAWKNIGISDEDWLNDFLELFDTLANNHLSTNWYFDSIFGFLLDDSKQNKYFPVCTYRHKENQIFPFTSFNDLMSKAKEYTQSNF